MEKSPNSWHYCGWKGVPCPVILYETCVDRGLVDGLDRELGEAKQEGNIQRNKQIANRLTELAHERCDLEKIIDRRLLGSGLTENERQILEGNIDSL